MFEVVTEGSYELGTSSREVGLFCVRIYCFFRFDFGCFSLRGIYLVFFFLRVFWVISVVI